MTMKVKLPRCAECGLDTNRDTAELGQIRFNRPLCPACFTKVKSDALSGHLARMEREGKAQVEVSRDEIRLQDEADRIRKSGKFFDD